MNGTNHPVFPRSSLSEGLLGGHLGRIRRSLSALSFWGAIALPAVYLPLLVAGIDTTGGLATFLLLFGFHVFALVGGYRHGRPSDR